jgi:hypothetical protein
MKINQSYLKGMLGAFESAEAPTTDIQELDGKGFKCSEDVFIFHLQILADQDFVQREQGHGLGYTKGAGGDISWSVVPLRLTAQGHDFIEALNNSQVWDTIKTEFKDASIGTLWKVSKGLLEGCTKKKLEALISSVD